MAVQAAAALLDELMGRYRNAAPTEKVKALNWEDSEYCRYYLVKFCPHDLFVNTRSDLGQCPKVHDDEAKNLFEKQAGYKKQTYEDEFVRFAQTMLNEVERKITKGRQRLALMGTKAEPPASISNAQSQKNDEQISMLTEKINKLVNEAEAAGIEGNVEQAQGLMKLCDQLKEEREALRKQNDNHAWSQTAELAAAQEKQMEVCEVCGAFLIVGDAQSRIDDHLMGKQHVGYARLRSAVEEIMDARAKEREEKEKRREEERKERRSKDDADRKRERERDRDRDRERRYRDEDDHRSSRESGRDRERERERDRDREREKEKDKDKDKDKERERDRDRRDRTKDDRSTRRSSRDRSRDRGDHRASRHEDRHNRRDRERDSERRDRDRDRDSERRRRD